MDAAPIRGQDQTSIVERFLDEVLNGRNPGAADELISDETFKQRVELFRQAFPDVEATANLVIVDGDIVAVNLTGRGTHLGTFQGVTPTGRQWAATCSAFYRISDGRIADHWVNWDLLGILEQIGAVRRIETASV